MRKISLRSAPAKLAAILALGLLLMALGCGRRAGSNLSPGGTPPPVVRPQENSQAGDRTEQVAVKQVVIDYLQALYKNDFTRAYDLLSEASRQAHPLEEFGKASRQAQVVYDLERAWTEKVVADRGEVIVPFSQGEEPGGKAFSLVKEKGSWKIVYNVGTPFSPYEK
jgi:hypothetical protein